MAKSLIILNRPDLLFWLAGAPGGIRTPDRLLRRQLLYPTELQAPGLQFSPAKVTRWQRYG